MEIKPVAHIFTAFSDKFGLPRQSGRVESLTGRIVFEPEFRDPEALRGIEEFSHLWLIFDFSEAHRETWSPTVRPPRLGGNRRIGVFASRSPFRPNSLGLSCVRLIGIEKTQNEGTVLLVKGVDLLSGTPIYDVKPYIPYADSHPDASGSYAEENSGHRLTVSISPSLLERIPEELRETVLGCVADDPRPSYQSDPKKVYGMRVGGLNVRFCVDGECAEIVSVEQKNG